MSSRRGRPCRGRVRGGRTESALNHCGIGEVCVGHATHSRRTIYKESGSSPIFHPNDAAGRTTVPRVGTGHGMEGSGVQVSPQLHERPGHRDFLGGSRGGRMSILRKNWQLSSNHTAADAAGCCALSADNARPLQRGRSTHGAPNSGHVAGRASELQLQTRRTLTISSGCQVGGR